MNADLTSAALSAFAGASAAIGGKVSPGETITGILAAIGESLGYKCGFFAVTGSKPKDAFIEAAYNIPGDKWKGEGFLHGEGIAAVILKTGEPLAIPRAGSDPRFINKMEICDPDSAFIGVPVKGPGGTTGVLAFTVNAAERYRLDDHLEIAAMFANLISGIASGGAVANVVKREGRLAERFGPEIMVGASRPMLDVLENIRRVAKWNAPVLIRGEPGTGKELAAKAIHHISQRAGGPFVTLNCEGMPESMIESELFGNDKAPAPSKLELAHKGTLFIDEAGALSPALQVKLLRVLREGKFERPYVSRTITVDTRVIAATHIDLEKAVTEKIFREDFYYTLSVAAIYIPPLRERKEDIPLLVEHILTRLGEERGAAISIDEDAMRALMNCNWRGNVRELESCVNRSAMRRSGSVITGEDVACGSAMCASRMMAASMGSAPEYGDAGDDDIMKIEDERERIIAALRKTGWVQAKTARLLNMTPRQIGYRIAKLNIEMKSY